MAIMKDILNVVIVQCDSVNTSVNNNIDMAGSHVVIAVEIDTVHIC